MSAASEAEQLELINSHPDLAGRAALAGEVTDESREEQVCHVRPSACWRVGLSVCLCLVCVLSLCAWFM